MTTLNRISNNARMLEAFKQLQKSMNNFVAEFQEYSANCSDVQLVFKSDYPEYLPSFDDLTNDIKKWANNSIQTLESVQSCLFVKVLDGMFIPCDTFRDCSRVIRLISDNIGIDKFYTHDDIGIIYHPIKGAFAHVSYNGIVWKGIEFASINKTQITDLDTNNY